MSRQEQFSETKKGKEIISKSESEREREAYFHKCNNINI